MTRPRGAVRPPGTSNVAASRPRQPGSVDEPDHRDDAPVQHRAEDLALDVADRLARGGRLEPCFLAEDLRLKRLELGARLDPELRDERDTRIAERLKRLGLPAAAVEREHP